MLPDYLVFHRRELGKRLKMGAPGMTFEGHMSGSLVTIMPSRKGRKFSLLVILERHQIPAVRQHKGSNIQ